MKSFSRWFRILFCLSFCLYIALWVWTIYLSEFQKANALEPVLPVIPQDSQEYHWLSESIINNHTFSQRGEEDTLRAPGYPFFIATFKYITNFYFTVTLIQIILVFFSAIIIRKLGEKFHSAVTGEIAASIFLFNPLVATLSLVILTDILFLFLFILGVYLSLYSRKTLISSLIFSAAIYVRPMGVFALPIFAAPLLARDVPFKDKLKSLVVMVFVILVAVSPWVYRNYKLTGVADFTSFKAINLAAYAVPLYLSNKNNTGADEERALIAREVGVPKSQWKDLRYSKKVASYAQNIILEQPFSYLKYHVLSSLPFLFSSSMQDAVTTYKSVMRIETKYEPGAINYLASQEWGMFFQSISRVWWKMLERVWWVFVYGIALIGFWNKRKFPAAYVFAFIPAYLMILAGPAANARYAVQGLPFVLLLFVVGAIYLKGVLTKTHVPQ